MTTKTVRVRLPRLAGLALLLVGALLLTGTSLTGGTAQAQTSGDLTPGSVSQVAAAEFDPVSGWQVVVVRTTTGQLFWTAGQGHSDGGLPPFWLSQGWRAIPGNKATLYAPAVARFNDRMYVAMVGTDKKMYLQSTDKLWNWTAGWTEMPGGGLFNGAPAMAEYRTQSSSSLVVVAPGSSNQLHYQFYRPGVNNSWYLVPGGLTATDIAVAVWDYTVHVVARGLNDNRIYHNKQLWDWSGWSEIPGGGLTYHRPSLALFEQYDGSVGPRLYLLVRGIQDGLGYQLMARIDTNFAWYSGWRYLQSGGTTPVAPALTSNQGDLRAYRVGHDKRLYYVNVYRAAGSTTLQIGTSGWTLVPRQ